MTKKDKKTKAKSLQSPSPNRGGDKSKGSKRPSLRQTTEKTKSDLLLERMLAMADEPDEEEEEETFHPHPRVHSIPEGQEEEEEEGWVSPTESQIPSQRRSAPSSGVKTRAKATRLAKANLDPESDHSTTQDSDLETESRNNSLREVMDPGNNQKDSYQGDESIVPGAPGSSRDPSLPAIFPVEEVASSSKEETAEEVAERLRAEDAAARKLEQQRKREAEDKRLAALEQKRVDAREIHNRFEGYYRALMTNCMGTLSTDQEEEWRRWWTEKNVILSPEGGEQKSHKMIHVSDRRVGAHIFKFNTQLPERDYGTLSGCLDNLDAMRSVIDVHGTHHDSAQARETYLNLGKILVFSLGLGWNWTTLNETMDYPIEKYEKKIMESEGSTQDEARERRTKWFIDDVNKHVHCMNRPAEGPTLREYRAAEEENRKALERQEREEREEREAAAARERRETRSHAFRGGTPDRPQLREHSVYQGNQGPRGVWGDKDGTSSYGPPVRRNPWAGPPDERPRRPQGRKHYQPYSGPPRHPNDNYYHPQTDSRWTSDGLGFETRPRSPPVSQGTGRDQGRTYGQGTLHPGHNSRETRQEPQQGPPASREQNTVPREQEAAPIEQPPAPIEQAPAPREQAPSSSSFIPPGHKGTGTFSRHPDGSYVEIYTPISTPIQPPGPTTLETSQNVLVTALELPTNVGTLHPDDPSWRKIITYLKEAQNQRVGIRADQWNPETRQCMNVHWAINAPEEYFLPSGELTHNWCDARLDILIRWMEDLKKKLPQTNDRESKFSRLQGCIVDNPLSINFMDSKQRSTDNSVIRAAAKILHHLYEFQELDGERLTLTEEMQLCKDAYKYMEIKGLREETKLVLITEIRRRSCDEGSNTLKSIHQFLTSVMKVIRDKLGQRHTTEYEFEGTLQARGASSSSSKLGAVATRPSGSSTKRDRSATKERPTKKSRPTVCKGCGYTLSTDKDTNRLVCRRKDANEQAIGCSNDPRRNKEQTDWDKSSVGKQWKAKGYDFIPKRTTMTLANAEDKGQGPSKKRGIAIHSLHADNILQPELIPFRISQVERKDAKRPRGAIAPPPEGKLLLDTGALGSNVMSNEYAKKLRRHPDCFSSKPARHSISTAAKNNLTSNKIMKVKINLVNEQSALPNKEVELDAVVAPIAVDLIVDRDTIKKNNLVARFPSHFTNGELRERLLSLPLLKPTNRQSVPSSSEANPRGIVDGVRLNLINTNPVQQDWIQSLKDEGSKELVPFFREQLEASLQRDEAMQCDSMPMFVANYTCKPWKRRDKKVYKKKTRFQRGHPPVFTKKEKKLINEFFLSYLNNTTVKASNLSDKSPYEREGKIALDEIPSHKLESIPTELIKAEEAIDEYLNVNIQGSPEIKERLRALVAKYKDIFRASVQETPSSAFEPFTLEVDLDKWELPCNATPPRTSGLQREQELERMLAILIKKGLIEDCTDGYYSHPFLTPKSNGSWRLVLDFKGLNRATTSKYEWPIPNIKDMLNRVGNSRPEFFAVFDLTSGYYQAPIAEESRKFTAFKTRRGVYRWKRLPMGLTDAGSYFQHQLSTKVLNGLINHICELYLDDCMVFASNTDEYMDRLEQVFRRFRAHKITLNPSKCHLGLSQVEYVGHTIDKNGLHFTRDKLDSVMNFPRPETMKHVKSFLGLANYFRDHIKNHSVRVQPLQDLVAGYTKQVARKKINWTTECDYAFKDVRQAIDECPLLWFVDEHSPIFLKTDASDYGIGAYLYQVVTGDDGKEVEHPIGFISKSLVSGHDSWDIPMKEGFAIFYALRKWEHLLRDRKFTVLTDHLNLTRLRNERSANKMVSRWFLAYQEYDIIEWKHVPGVENEVPDSFSRLCASLHKGDNSPAEESPTSMLFQLTGYEMDTEHWKIIQEHGHGTNSEQGHGGVQRTIALLRRLGHNWTNMAKDVSKFIKMCPCCQKMNVIKPVIHSYPFTLSSYGLFHTVSVDLIERLKPDEYGMSMIVVIIDNFSRFVDLYPISDTSAEAAADALLQFTGRYKTPERFTTDSGSNFKSALVDGLISRLGADHQFTQAYSKEQNALVERVNREVLSRLKAIVFDKRIQNKWSKYLPIVQRYINTSVHSSTGCTPAEIVFPSGADIDKSLVVDMGGVVASAYIKDMQEAQARIIALAEQKLREKDKKHMRSRVGIEPTYEPGTYVLVEHRHNSLRRGPKSKLLPFLKGPLLVERKCATPGMYTLRDLITMRLVDYHVSKLHPFRYDERTLQPAQVAATDSFDEFIVQEVIKMRGDPRKAKSQIAFLIRWAGYDESNDTWESWKDCHKANAVQRFLYNHKDKRVNRLCMPGYDPDELDNQEDVMEISDDDSA
jgi:hypothetical protein